MRERGETEEYIAEIYETLTPPEREVLQKVKVRIKSLYSAEIGLDETILLLQLFLKYRQMEANKWKIACNFCVCCNWDSR